MFEFTFGMVAIRIKIIIVFTIIRLTIFGILLMRWGSNRKYAILGGHRAVAQVISYEVCIFILILALTFI